MASDIFLTDQQGVLKNKDRHLRYSLNTESNIVMKTTPFCFKYSSLASKTSISYNLDHFPKKILYFFKIIVLSL